VLSESGNLYSFKFVFISKTLDNSASRHVLSRKLTYIPSMAQLKDLGITRPAKSCDILTQEEKSGTNQYN
jgi:hypothetical protein